MRTLAFLLLILCRFVADIDIFPGVDGYIRHGHGRGIRDKQGTHAVVVDGQFLNPFAVDFLGCNYVNDEISDILGWWAAVSIRSTKPISFCVDAYKRAGKSAGDIGLDNAVPHLIL